MFQIKICGITNIADAVDAVDAGADALGLNFYANSPRYVSPEQAAEIVRAVEDRCQLVGLFVNSTLQEILNVAAIVPFHTFQLHGDEPAELVFELRTLHEPDFISRHPMLGWLLHKIRVPGRFAEVVRAFRCRGADLTDVEQALRECQAAGALPNAVLLDAYQPGSFGGTGRVVDWDVVRSDRGRLAGLPVVLAGGLTPENVAAAISASGADAVDTASGVEVSPGKKDRAKMCDFVQTARAGFGR